MTGNVNTPGRYSGDQSETIFDFLIKADGINPKTGSFRKIEIKRLNKTIETIDLYDFIQFGILPKTVFRTNDTIIVPPKGPEVTVLGGAKHTSSFEFKTSEIKGSTLTNLALPNSDISHAKITNATHEFNSETYYKIEDFYDVILSDGDTVEFISDKAKNTVNVYVEGTTNGQKQFSISQKTSLKELLSFISVDQDLVNLNAIHIERRSVAEAQKVALEQSLFNFKTALLRPSTTQSEMQVRAAEAS